MPKINGNEIRPGNVLEHNGGLWAAVKVDHVKPGKGGAFAQVELRNLRNGSKLNERFRSADKVERVRLEQKDQQFLYESDGMLVFMDSETYEQIEVPGDLIGTPKAYLQEGMNCAVQTHEGSPINVTLPKTVVMTVTEADPVVKGQTQSSSYKPAVLENGERVLVPPHIETGTRIVVHTADGAYSERAKD